MKNVETLSNMMRKRKRVHEEKCCSHQKRVEREASTDLTDGENSVVPSPLLCASNTIPVPESRMPNHLVYTRMRTISCTVSINNMTETFHNTSKESINLKNNTRSSSLPKGHGNPSESTDISKQKCKRQLFDTNNVVASLQPSVSIASGTVCKNSVQTVSASNLIPTTATAISYPVTSTCVQASKTLNTLHNGTCSSNSLLTSTVTVSEQTSDILVQNDSESTESEAGIYLCVCTCCHKTLPRHWCLIFKEKNYNFENAVVTEALAVDIRYKQSGMHEFICKNCHHHLWRKQTALSLPVMPNDAIASPKKYQTVNYLQVLEMPSTTCPTPCVVMPSQEVDTCSTMNIDRNLLCVCTCCHSTLRRQLCVAFWKANYDFADPIVCDALSEDIRFMEIGVKEFICKKCHTQLWKNKNSKVKPRMPIEAVASPRKGAFTCLLCDYTGPRRYCCDFDEKAYNNISDEVENRFAQIRNDTDSNSKKFICRKCHNKLLNSSTITCLSCSNIVKRTCAVIVDQTKYTSSSSTLSKLLPNIPVDNYNRTMLICRQCDTKLLGKVFICICCARNIEKKALVIFKKEKYDHSKEIVKKLLSHANENCSSNEKQYICKTCHSNLRIKENREPTVPKLMQSKQKSCAAQKFLKALKNKPEFVCTCCHRWLFRKSVVVFHDKDFDFDNAIVANALSPECRYKTKTFCDVFNNSSQPGCAESEYICVTCKRNLSNKRPKMPAQAVANGLDLLPIPDALSNLTDLERRLISLRIPFMKILSLFRYGSHYKVDGPPVNVPTTLDKICSILPRIPDEAHVYPMKLKRKLSYKGSYMYNTIRKDVVMNALKWLKENNEYYNDIKVNEFWADSWENDELGLLIDANNDAENISGEVTDPHDDITHVSEDESETAYVKRKQDEKELREDQLAADKMAEINGQPDSCTLQLEHIEDGVYSVAPGEDNLPKYVLLDKEFEVLAFPDMFPFGTGGFHTIKK